MAASLRQGARTTGAHSGRGAEAPRVQWWAVRRRDTAVRRLVVRSVLKVILIVVTLSTWGVYAQAACDKSSRPHCPSGKKLTCQKKSLAGVIGISEKWVCRDLTQAERAEQARRDRERRERQERAERERLREEQRQREELDRKQQRAAEESRLAEERRARQEERDLLERQQRRNRETQFNVGLVAAGGSVLAALIAVFARRRKQA